MNHSEDVGLKRATLLVVTLSNFLATFSGSSVNIALPSIGKEFKMNAISLSWIATAFILPNAMLLIPFGRLGDLYGRRKIFSYGILTYTASSLLLAISNSSMTLIFFRVLQGMGGAMIFATGMAILISIVPVGERGKAIGINAASAYVGLSTGPVVGGFLTQYFGWRSIFVSMVPLGLIIIIFNFWKLKEEWTKSEGEKFDFTGGVIYCFTLFSIMYGFSLLPAMIGFGFILIGILGLLALVRWEDKAESPLLNFSLFRKNTLFILSNVAALINFSATFAVTFLLSLYLQYTKGLSPRDAGLILISQPVVQAIFSPIAGRLSDWIEPRIVSSIGMAATVIGLLSFTFLREKTTLAYIIASLIFLGFGFALFAAPNTNAVMSSVEKKFYGIASAMVATMRLTGGMFSMGITMLVFGVYIGRGQIRPEHYPLFLKSAKAAFAIFALLCFGGIFASLARGKVRRRTKDIE